MREVLCREWVFFVGFFSPSRQMPREYKTLKSCELQRHAGSQNHYRLVSSMNQQLLPEPKHSAYTLQSCKPHATAFIRHNIIVLSVSFTAETVLYTLKHNFFSSVQLNTTQVRFWLHVLNWCYIQLVSLFLSLPPCRPYLSHHPFLASSREKRQDWSYCQYPNYATNVSLQILHSLLIALPFDVKRPPYWQYRHRTD
jgi:hypothetical protein